MRPNIFAILILFFFGGSLYLKASAQSLEQHVVRIDSLIIYNEQNKAKKAADSLHHLFLDQYTASTYTDLKLAVMLQKADIMVSQANVKDAISLLLEVIDEAQKSKLPELEYKAHLIAALTYELLGDLNLCDNHLDQAYDLYIKYKLEHRFSTYCIRRSSYFRFADDKQSAITFAYKGLEAATRFHVQKDIADANLLLGIFLEGEVSIQHTLSAAAQFLRLNDFESAAAMHNNAGHAYLDMGNISRAFLYNDSAIIYDLKGDSNIDAGIHKLRSKLYEKTGETDSAFSYFKKYHTAHLKYLNELDAKAFKDISDKYENDKKEAIIKSKNQQMILISALLALVAIGAALMIRKNRKINSQNKTINLQLAQLSKTLEQKKVLLSELQHRVKNNLQHVIAILEIQKESVDFNNIEELIRGNQNRIHSMALLHKKLNVEENVNEVNLKKYITELSEIVKASYDSHKKAVNLIVSCEIETISIEYAMPLGLIIVELVSNSMKHAFKDRGVGLINIEIKKGKDAIRNKLEYKDNGTGFDFNYNGEKGLGLEIIKGLIDQLSATTSTNNDAGFELIIYF